jgi:lipoate synthase
MDKTLKTILIIGATCGAIYVFTKVAKGKTPPQHLNADNNTQDIEEAIAKLQSGQFYVAQTPNQTKQQHT